MDNKQAIEELKQIKQNYIDLNYRFRHLYDDYIIALDIAIASLEAWDKVIKELEQDAFNDVNGSKFICVDRVNQIINKHLKESD